MAVSDLRKLELVSKAYEIIAQEARHLADTADYDQVTTSDEEDEFLRDALKKAADDIEAWRKKPLLNKDQVEQLLKQGAEERKAYEKTLKRSPRR